MCFRWLLDTSVCRWYYQIFSWLFFPLLCVCSQQSLIFIQQSFHSLHLHLSSEKKKRYACCLTGPKSHNILHPPKIFSAEVYQLLWSCQNLEFWLDSSLSFSMHVDNLQSKMETPDLAFWIGTRLLSCILPYISSWKWLFSCLITVLQFIKRHWRASSANGTHDITQQSALSQVHPSPLIIVISVKWWIGLRSIWGSLNTGCC